MRSTLLTELAAHQRGVAPFSIWATSTAPRWYCGRVASTTVEHPARGPAVAGASRRHLSNGGGHDKALLERMLRRAGETLIDSRAVHVLHPGHRILFLTSVEQRKDDVTRRKRRSEGRSRSPGTGGHRGSRNATTGRPVDRPTSGAIDGTTARLASLLILLVVVASVPALGAGYIWDDDRYVTDNPLLTDLAGLVQIWTNLAGSTASMVSARFDNLLAGVPPLGVPAAWLPCRQCAAARLRGGHAVVDLAWLRGSPVHGWLRLCSRSIPCKWSRSHGSRNERTCCPLSSTSPPFWPTVIPLLSVQVPCRLRYPRGSAGSGMRSRSSCSAVRC